MKKLATILSLSAVLIIAGCYEFVFVNQPFTANPNSSFDVQICAYVDGSDGTTGQPTVGIMLPIGWTLYDVAYYANEDSTLTGKVNYSESFSQNMSTYDPPPANYYWWVATDTAQSVGHGTYLLSLKIFNDNQTGSFFLDYMLGNGKALNEKRSNAHLIIVGEINGCAPEGITFTSQQEVDDFTTNYPDCETIAGDISIEGDNISNLDGLSSITSIGGSLRINNNSQLTNLSGLNNLVSVGGLVDISNNEELQSINGLNALASVGREMVIEENPDLQFLGGFESLTTLPSDLMIIENSTLTSVAGLNNLNTVDGYLTIENNSLLTSLSGFGNLTSIGEDFSIQENYALESLSGLESLTDIAGDFSVDENYALISLSGLENLNSIGGDLTVHYNHALTSLSGLNNLTSIGTYLYIYNNNALASLSGLDNLNSVGEELSIHDNPLLCNCAIESICSLLSNQPGQVITAYNGEGCSSKIELAVACGTTLPCPEEGFINFFSQFDIDHFSLVYPDCSDIPCSVDISGSMNNLDSLYIISSIGGSLFINTENLSSLSGLGNLTTIGNHLSIYSNDSLTSLSGLENLTSIGSYFSIGGNDALTNLEALGNLDSIGGSLSVHNNNTLSNFQGLENIHSIGGDLSIEHNDVLVSLSGLNSLTTIGGSFSVHYSDALTSLSGLNSLTTIVGSFSVRYSDALTSLSGLDNLVSIGSDQFGRGLSIYENDGLISLSGLESLSSIEGSISISYNDSLASLLGLENLASIGGNLSIIYNPILCNCEVEFICTCLSNPPGEIEIYGNGDGCSSMIELAVDCGTTIPCLEEGTIWISSQFDVDHFPVVFPGCSNIPCSISIYGDMNNLDSLAGITSICGHLRISGTDSLTSLYGLQNLETVGVGKYGEGLGIYSNSALSSLSGLESLTTIGGDLCLEYNTSLTSLIGLENLTAIGNNLTIVYNQSLCSCEAEAVCNYLSDPPGYISIHDNGNGCSNLIEIAVSCGTTLPCPEVGTYELNSQFEVDHFLTVYEGCSDIACSFSIGGDVKNLDSLAGITRIGGYLSIYGTDSLTSLSGLQNLVSIGGVESNFGLRISSNSALKSLSGLENLVSIEEEGLIIAQNDSLASLSDLRNLVSIGGFLEIFANASLTSLTGLENIEASSIQNLYITYNSALSTCEVQSICDYLASPNGTIEIYDNATGCNSEVEVLHACWLITIEDENTLQNQFTFYPNPATSDVKLSGEFGKARTVNICIYSMTGSCLKNWKFSAMQDENQEFTLNLSELPPGIYFLRLQAGNELITKKIVKL